MTNLHYKNQTFSLDNASASLTALTNYLNAASIQGVQAIFNDENLGVDEPNFYPGTASGTFSISGLVNTTTDGIFGPLLGQRTSVSKTYSYYNGTRYYTGEAYPTSVQYSGSPNNMQTFSAEFQCSAGINRTSVAPS